MNQTIENPTLKEAVDTDTELKEWLVNYVGQNLDPNNENGEVTVEMIVETVSKEFPEFLLGVAEENWVRGDSENTKVTRLISRLVEWGFVDKLGHDNYKLNFVAIGELDVEK